MAEGTNVGAINLLLKIRTNIADQINQASAEAKQQAAQKFEAVGQQAGNSYSKGFSASIKKSKASINSMEKQLETLRSKMDAIRFNTRNGYKDVALDRKTLNQIVEHTLSMDKAYQKMLAQEEKFAERVRLMREKLGIDIAAFEEKKVQNAQKSAQKQASIAQREAERQRRKEEKAELAAQKAREKRLLKSTKGIRSLGSNIKKAFKSVFLMTAVYAAFKTLRTLFASATRDSKKFTDSLNTVKANLMAAFTPVVSAVMPMLEALMAKLAQITTAITSFIAGVFGKTYSQVMAKTKKLQSAAGGGKSGGLAAFDEINQLSSAGDGTSAGIDFSAVNTEGDKAAITLGEKFKAVIARIGEFLMPLKESLSTMFDGAVQAFTAFTEAVSPGLLFLWETVFLPVITWIRDAFASGFNFIGQKFSEMAVWFNQRADVISLALRNLGIAFNTVWSKVIKPMLDTLKAYMGGVIDWLLTAFGGVADFLLGVFTGNWKMAFKGLLNIVVGMVNAAISALEGLLNSAVRTINNLLGMIKNTGFGEFLQDKLNMSLSISSVSLPRIPVPQFANGAIISQPTLGLMGEYAGAYSNPEIVAPQSLMLETFMAAVEPLIASIRQFIENTQAGQIINIHLDASLSAFARYIQPYLDDEAKRRGVKLVIET